MPAFDILQYYPQSGGRSSLRMAITEEQREISRRFDFDYFDGERQYGYGGYSYHPRFWTDTVQHIAGHYSLDNSSSILDVGCAKGFMLKDLQILLPGATLARVDISDYAIGHAEHEAKELVRVACATDLPFENDSFDLVLSINTLHNLDRAGCIKALGEVQRVSKRDAWMSAGNQRCLRRLRPALRRGTVRRVTTITCCANHQSLRNSSDHGISMPQQTALPEDVTNS